MISLWLHYSFIFYSYSYFSYIFFPKKCIITVKVILVIVSFMISLWLHYSFLYSFFFQKNYNYSYSDISYSFIYDFIMSAL